MNQIKFLKRITFGAGLSCAFAFSAHAQKQSDNETPYTGKLSCAQILKLGASGTTDYYEKKLNAELKWAYADYNRCKNDENAAGLSKLSSDKQKTIGKLRDTLESYFDSFYTMQVKSVGGGNPFELDILSHQTDVEDLIGKAITIYSKPSAPKPDLRKQVEAHIAKIEKRLTELTATPKDEDLDWLDATTEDGREEIKTLQEDYEKAATEFRRSVKNFRLLVKDLPDSLALLSAEVFGNL